MSLILPASSSPDLKAFPLRSKSSKSSEGGQGETVSSVSAFLQSSLRSSFQEAATPATDSPDTRFSIEVLVVLSECLCLWRKDPYLPSQPLSVRHLPRTNVLACSMFVPAFRHCFAAPKVSPDHPSGERNSRFCFSASLGFISRPKVCDWFISMAKGCILRLSPPDAFVFQVMFNNLLYNIYLPYGIDVLKTCNRLAWSLKSSILCLGLFLIPCFLIVGRRWVM